MNYSRFLIITSLVAILAACGGAEERKAAYMEKAEQSIKAGDLEKARIELKNVLQIDPKDAAAFYKLGTVYEHQKDYRKAFANYSKAESLSPDNPEYHAKIGRFYLVLAGDIEKAKEELTLVQKINKDDINGLLLEAGIALKENNSDKAVTISQKLFDNHPENIENAIFLSTLYSKDKQYNKAIAVLDKALGKNPDDVSLMSALGNTLYISKDNKRAESIYKNILEKHPDSFQNHLKLAVFYQQTEQTERAEAVLRSAINLEPDDIKRKLVLIEFIQQTGGNEQAIQELENQIKQSSGNGELQLALAELQIKNNNINDAIETYKKTIKDFSEEGAGIKSRIMLAKIYMQKGEVDNATSIINEAAEISPNDADVNLIKAKIALTRKDNEQAIVSLRTVIKDRPENVEAYFLLASAHKANNEPQQAEDIIAKAYENNRSNVKALLPIAKYYIQNKNTTDAEKAINDYLRLDPDNYEALSMKCSLLNGNKKFSEARKLAEQLVALHPDKENGYIQSVPAYLMEKKIDKAISILDTGYQKSGKSVKILKVLADLEIASGKATEAISRLKKAIPESNEEELRLVLAKAYITNNDTDSAIRTLQESLKDNPANIQSYISLAGIYLKYNRVNDAVSILKKGISENKKDLKTRFLLSSIYDKTGETDNAIKIYDDILAIDDNNILAINNLAALLSEQSDKGSIERALKLSDKIKAVEQPAIKDTVGWVYYKAGRLDEAMRKLTEAVTESPENIVFNYHLGMTYYKSGDKIEARKYLEKATSTDLKYPGRDTAEKTLKLL